MDPYSLLVFITEINPKRNFEVRSILRICQNLCKFPIWHEFFGFGVLLPVSDVAYRRVPTLAVGDFDVPAKALDDTLIDLALVDFGKYIVIIVRVLLEAHHSGDTSQIIFDLVKIDTGSIKGLVFLSCLFQCLLK